jgi:aspartate racemase
MKTIGLIGGLNWVSTIDYYRLLNEMVNDHLGGSNSARILMHSVNFADIRSLTDRDDWDRISEMMCAIAQQLENAGAEVLMLGANTMHKIADDVEKAISIPLVHVVDATGKQIVNNQLKKVALLGTRFTMELPFYKDRLKKMDIDAIIPDQKDRKFIHDAIYDELQKELFLPETKQEFINIINRLVEQGAEGIILGCTEIPLLIKQKDISVPMFDTTKIHAAAAVEEALKN